MAPWFVAPRSRSQSKCSRPRPGSREDLPCAREPNPLHTSPRRVHGCGITDIALTPARAWSPRRHASAWAVATLLVTAVGATANLLVFREAVEASVSDAARNEMITSFCYLLSYGVAGAFLISRRPDLPFGWLLAGAAGALTLSAVTTGPAYVAVSNGETGTLVRWGLG